MTAVFAPIIANVGVLALYLLFIWLGSAIAASALSDRKGWGEKPGLASGLLLSAIAPIVWLLVPRRRVDQAPGAAAALVLGVVGIVVPVLAPFAWKQGTEVEQKIAQSDGKLSGLSMAKAARILGMVGTGLLAIGIVVALVVAGSGSSY
jgi:hypothetical protein